jgi:hypothetical protein
MAEEIRADDAPERALQLEQLQLGNEKLRQELASLRSRRPWYGALAQMVPMITVLLAMAGFFWGMLQYRWEQGKNRETAEREFMKPWLESQRDIYSQALAAAATIPNTEDEKTRKQATEEFWRLYEGKMVLVETTKVSDAMMAFGNCLTVRNSCSKQDMNNLCLSLGTAMADSMALTAKMTYNEFAANQFHYSSGSR